MSTEMGFSLVSVLRALADDCEHDDAAALAGPWSWKDGTMLWNESVDQCVLSHDDTHWPVSAGNRSVIAGTRNRLPELVHWLREAAQHLDAQNKGAVAAFGDAVSENEQLRARVEVLEEKMKLLTQSVIANSLAE